jgi:hypothetical protein
LNPAAGASETVFGDILFFASNFGLTVLFSSEILGLTYVRI